jgi:hypothetical protein
MPSVDDAPRQGLTGETQEPGRRHLGIFLCVVAAAVIISGVFSPGMWRLGDNDTPGIIVCLAFFVLYFGWALAEGRKTPVVYLRHFGLTDGNRMISEAMTVLGSRYRIVTLDDLEIRPTVAPRLQIVIFVASPVIAAIVLIGVAAYLNELRPTFFEWQRLIVIFTVGTCALMSSIHIWRVWRRSRLHVATEQDVMKVMRRIVELSHALRGSRLLEPQITVVRVSSTLWKLMLVTLLEYTNNVIVDVSAPTGNVLWELRLIPDLQPCVIVANNTPFQHWLNNADGPEETRKLYEKTRMLLGDHEVLLYDTEDRAQAREWQRHLRRVLDSRTTALRRAPRQMQYLRARRRSVLTRVLLYVSVGIVWTYGVTAKGWIEPLFGPIERLARSLAQMTQ